MKRSSILVTFSILLTTAPMIFASTLAIVTTTTDLADFARAIGGQHVSVTCLSRGDVDPHAVEPRPSMVMQVKRADLLIRVGMDLDLWVEGLIDASRNRTVMRGGRGYLDASDAVEKLEIPEGKIDGSRGDIHIYGNPHYWTCPVNAGLILDLILSRMIALRPDEEAYFRQNHSQYAKMLRDSVNAWKQRLAPFSGTPIVTYHNSWPYFARCFNLAIAGYVEPKPGIPPTPSHIAELTATMKSMGVRVIVMEPWFNRKTAESVASKSNARVVVLAPSAGGTPGADTYLTLVSRNVTLLADALAGKGGGQ